MYYENKIIESILPNAFNYRGQEKFQAICHEYGRFQKSLVAELQSKAEYAPYEQAVLDWMVITGGVPYFFGGVDYELTAVIRYHLLRGCSLNYTQSTAPKFTYFDEFGGTDCGNLSVTGVECYLTCRCRRIKNIRWANKDVNSVSDVTQQVIAMGQR